MTISTRNSAGQNTKKKIDLNKLSNAQKNSVNSPDPNVRKSKLLGIGNQASEVPKPKLIKTSAETIFKDENNNLSIVFKRDRPGSTLTGYGGQGYPSATIELTAGHVYKFARTSFPSADGQTEQDAYVDPSFEYDASKIYISERTDPDENLGIVQSTKFNTTPNMKNRPSIILKSESVRIVGEEGIKLVTGVYNKGDKTPAGIQLIALNYDGGRLDIQPFVKGNNFLTSYFHLWEEVLTLNGLLQEFVQYQNEINNIFREHTHTSAAVGKQSSPGRLGKAKPKKGEAKAVTEARPYENFSIAIENFVQANQTLVDRAEEQLNNLLDWEQIWTNPQSENFLLSEFNGTN